MKKDRIYDLHFKTFVKDVLPQSDIDHLINLFMLDSSTMMGNNYTDATLELTIQMVKEEFAWLPVYYVAIAFKKGALGKLGAGRLVGSTIHRWLSETVQQYHTDIDHAKQKAIDEEIYTRYDLRKYPIGKAIMQKIDWYKAGKLQGDDWDNVSLKELAEAIGNKEVIEFNRFYIPK
jgi:hypothetical protein